MGRNMQHANDSRQHSINHIYRYITSNDARCTEPKIGLTPAGFVGIIVCVCCVLPRVRLRTVLTQLVYGRPIVVVLKMLPASEPAK